MRNRIVASLCKESSKSYRYYHLIHHDILRPSLGCVRLTRYSNFRSLFIVSRTQLLRCWSVMCWCHLLSAGKRVSWCCFQLTLPSESKDLVLSIAHTLPSMSYYFHSRCSASCHNLCVHQGPSGSSLKAVQYRYWILNSLIRINGGQVWEDCLGIIIVALIFSIQRLNPVSLDLRIHYTTRTNKFHSAVT